MRDFKTIYEAMLQPGERFTIRQLIAIFENESSWVGSQTQLHQIKDFNLELTGVRTGDCQGCMMTAIKNVARWVNKYENDVILLSKKKNVKR